MESIGGTMKELCAKCTVCMGIGILEQKEKRNLSFQSGNENDILIIDTHDGDRTYPYLAIGSLLGKRGVEYTTTVRCTHKKIWDDTREQIVGRCSVWTHQLLTGRSLILATEEALKQIGIQREWVKGKIYKSAALGLIVCIPPLHDVDEDELSILSLHIGRALKEIER